MGDEKPTNVARDSSPPTAWILGMIALICVVFLGGLMIGGDLSVKHYKMKITSVWALPVNVEIETSKESIPTEGGPVHVVRIPAGDKDNGERVVRNNSGTALPPRFIIVQRGDDAPRIVPVLTH